MKKGGAKFQFKPFSLKQKKLLTWWTKKSPFQDYDMVIADGAVGGIVGGIAGAFGGGAMFDKVKSWWSDAPTTPPDIRRPGYRGRRDFL